METLTIFLTIMKKDVRYKIAIVIKKKKKNCEFKSRNADFITLTIASLYHIILRTGQNCDFITCSYEKKKSEL